MAFLCEVSFDEVKLGAPLPRGAATFQRYSNEAGAFVEAGEPLLLFRSSEHTFEVRSRFRAQLRDMPRSAGDLLTPDTVLVTLGAEGEDIPPGFRYCSLHEVSVG